MEQMFKVKEPRSRATNARSQINTPRKERDSWELNRMIPAEKAGGRISPVGNLVMVNHLHM